ncbi:MAG TPA: phosphoesterase, partial [Janthinobacterium sp.]|nr:phosphoesterase [Janthinobacterium sp.]
MPSIRNAVTSKTIALTAIAAAAALAACGSNGPAAQASVTMQGVVVATGFTPGSATDPTLTAGYYQGALVCVDANNNGKCDASENPV